jgi:ribosomal protein L20
MPRVKRGTVRRAKRKKLLKRAKGFYATKSKLYQAAQEAVDKALSYAYSGRRRKKRDFRRLWVVRINAAARQHGLTYGQLISGLGRRRRPGSQAWPTSRSTIRPPSRCSPARRRRQAAKAGATA